MRQNFFLTFEATLFGQPDRLAATVLEELGVVSHTSGVYMWV